ncbi:MAG: hypothetical protein Q7L07_02670 [Pseudohongiella sp.]|nr:hypothetical protein [Pseudohongiella sp.]
MKSGLLPAIAINSIAMLISSVLYFSEGIDNRGIEQQPEVTQAKEAFQQRAERTRAAALINRVTTS